MKFILYASLLSVLSSLVSCSSSNIPASPIKSNITKTTDSMSGKALYDAGQKVWYDNPKKSLELNIKAANKGYNESNAVIARFYEEARGVPKNNSLAIKYYKKGARNGDSWAKYKLAGMYASGRGTEQNYSAALKLYLDVALLKDHHSYYDAENEIGYLYLNGYGVKKDLNKAEYWFKQSYKHQPNEMAGDNIKLVKKLKKK